MLDMARDRLVTFRVSPEEYEVLERQASLAQRTVSDWVRLKVVPSNYIKEVAASIRESAKRQDEEDIERFLLNTPRADAPIAGIKFEVKGVACDHAGTEIGKLSGVGSCPKCGKTVTKKEVTG